MISNEKSYWLIKSEPETWSFQQQKCKGKEGEHWDGVRNYQARNYMKNMKKNDICLFYHSGKEKQIVGLVTVKKTYYPDHTDPTGNFGMVDVQYLCDAPKALTLKTIKSTPELQKIPLVVQPRLSVMPIDSASFWMMCQMMELEEDKII